LPFGLILKGAWSTVYRAMANLGVPCAIHILNPMADVYDNTLNGQLRARIEEDGERITGLVGG
jgi:hypothetical protein